MAFVRPEEVVKNFGLEPGMTVADFGCGSGYYSLAAAKMIGDHGKVFAIDVQKELLESVKSNARLNNLNNIEFIWADLEIPEGSHLAPDSVDLVIISNILFQAEDQTAVAKEAFRVLKNKGRLAVMEWSESFGGLGPRPENVVKKDKCEKIFIEQGFILDKEFEPGEHHYGLIFAKHV